MAEFLVFENPCCRCRAHPCVRVFCGVCGAVLAAHHLSRVVALDRAVEMAGNAHRCGPDPYEFGGFRNLGPLVVRT